MLTSRHARGVRSFFAQIARAYPSVDGFCVLMGTDTMAYASTGAVRPVLELGHSLDATLCPVPARQRTPLSNAHTFPLHRFGSSVSAMSFMLENLEKPVIFTGPCKQHAIAMSGCVFFARRAHARLHLDCLHFGQRVRSRV